MTPGKGSVASFRLRRFVVWSLPPAHVAKEARDDGDQLQRAHFPQDIILMGVRWYVAYPLSTRHVEERMLERGVHVEHSTINLWVVKYSPQLEIYQSCNLHKILSWPKNGLLCCQTAKQEPC